MITDGGSNQEELSYLGKPTLLMRRATERQEGLGGKCCFMRVRQDEIASFSE